MAWRGDWDMLWTCELGSLEYGMDEINLRIFGINGECCSLKKGPDGNVDDEVVTVRKL
jgi:hypothetical protein